MHATGQELRGATYGTETSESVEPFPILKSKGSEGQLRIEAVPDEIWEWKKPGKPPILKKAAHLLLTQGQDTSTARLTAVASDNRYVGNGWVPVTGLDPTQSKAAAVFCNSTPGRLLLMRNPGKKLGFPFYSADALSALSVPNLDDGSQTVELLAACWEESRKEIVPQFRDGYTPVRRHWDQAVCDALGWDIDEIAELGELLAREPRVRGVAYGQWKA